MAWATSLFSNIELRSVMYGDSWGYLFKKYLWPRDSFIRRFIRAREWLCSSESELVDVLLSSDTCRETWCRRIQVVSYASKIDGKQTMSLGNKPCRYCDRGVKARVDRSARSGPIHGLSSLIGSSLKTGAIFQDAISLATCLQIAGKSKVPLAVKVHNKLRYVRLGPGDTTVLGTLTSSCRYERVCCCQLLGFVNQICVTELTGKLLQQSQVPFKLNTTNGFGSTMQRTMHTRIMGRHFVIFSPMNPFETQISLQDTNTSPRALTSCCLVKKNQKEIQVDGDWSRASFELTLLSVLQSLSTGLEVTRNDECIETFSEAVARKVIIGDTNRTPCSR